MPNTVAKRAMPIGRPFPPGVSGNPGGSSRARRDLNADTIRAMHAAFREGGRQAIDKVMKNQPAAFLKLLCLLVPRELEVAHSGGLKSLSDAELEAGIEMIRVMLAAREAGANAKVNGEFGDVILLVPAPSERYGTWVQTWARTAIARIA